MSSLWVNIEIGVRVDHGKSQPTDNRLPERGVVTSRDPF